jgi:hypothetical protein
MVLKISSLSPNEAVNLGIREWPQQVKRGTFTEDVKEGAVATRYVLEGSATVSTTSDSAIRILTPGTLLEVTGPTTLQWKVTSDETILLTPGYEEGGKLAAVALGLATLCGAILAGGLS